ncbi:glyoxylase-like metal-dependent hydrolase (beta-lactamase superfamily II) [Deinobacterium chartae]|uniref:Glyoxylase-like metal-dependent hydrolase (Beta-lactamase superfamily II) n=1 Tax=Deinobacterium chartae TaxID=521158 RepID=A0A841HVW0_9DEIO|nr:MBL fold metallo-hydrolase [Deinobacterium chartae]MBB6097651.1 glyoxylase-like metal-dependent hydrolase (beta-lactamase superfamily II) [Deinobacterium chartae]
MQVHTLDLRFQGLSGVIASYLIEAPQGPLLVDPGPASTLETLRAELAGHGVRLEEVRHILLTHIHLDHAGASGTLAALSGATVYVHERGARHMARPARLLESARMIYQDRMDALWGEMRPVPEAQLNALSGGERLNLEGLELEAIYTPGHAVHHLAWAAGDALFCGDVAGVRLEVAQSPRAPTPPPDVDLPAWRRSLATLRARGAGRLYLSHFGEYDDVDAHLGALAANLEQDAVRVEELLATADKIEDVVATFTGQLEQELRLEGGEDLVARFRFACPPWMSVQGLARYWTRVGGLRE